MGHFILTQMTLAIKKTKLMTIGTAISLRIDSVATEMLNNFYLLRSISNSKIISNQEICHRPELSKVAMKKRYSDAIFCGTIEAKAGL